MFDDGGGGGAARDQEHLANGGAQHRPGEGVVNLLRSRRNKIYLRGLRRRGCNGAGGRHIHCMGGAQECRLPSAVHVGRALRGRRHTAQRVKL